MNHLRGRGAGGTEPWAALCPWGSAPGNHSSCPNTTAPGRGLELLQQWGVLFFYFQHPAGCRRRVRTQKCSLHEGTAASSPPQDRKQRTTAGPEDLDLTFSLPGTEMACTNVISPTPFCDTTSALLMRHLGRREAYHRSRSERPGQRKFVL